MATRQFRVHVIKPDGRQGVESRRVVNFPDIAEDQVEPFLRAEWARHYPGEKYPSIEPIGQDEYTPQPHPGMFPSSFNQPA